MTYVIILYVMVAVVTSLMYIAGRLKGDEFADTPRQAKDSFGYGWTRAILSVIVWWVFCPIVPIMLLLLWVCKKMDEFFTHYLGD